MTRDAARCPTCGAKIVRYRHTMNRGLVGGLVALAEAGGEASLADLGLTRNQVDNFQKLRYWGLVEKVHRDDGTRVAGVWRVTLAGYRFLVGDCVRSPRRPRGCFSMPKRVQLSRRKGYRKPEGAINVARPTKWGNPFPVAAGGREWAVASYRRWLRSWVLDEQIRRELGGHDLACWCPLDQPCHADVLLELANA
jgi:hypothetical protein